MKTYMLFTFGTDVGKDVTVRIPNIISNVNEYAVIGSMDRIYQANALHPKHGSLTGKKKAVQYFVNTIDLDVV